MEQEAGLTAEQLNYRQVTFTLESVRTQKALYHTTIISNLPEYDGDPSKLEEFLTDGN